MFLEMYPILYSLSAFTSVETAAPIPLIGSLSVSTTVALARSDEDDDLESLDSVLYPLSDGVSFVGVLHPTNSVHAIAADTNIATNALFFIFFLLCFSDWISDIGYNLVVFNIAPTYYYVNIK